MSTLASRVSVSPGTTAFTNLNASALRRTYTVSGSLIEPSPGSMTSEQSCASDSIMSTPGMTGISGKCPAKYGSLTDTFLMPFAYSFGLISVTFSTIWNGGRCFILLLISKIFIITIAHVSRRLRHCA